jgi:hypothetical protein
MDVRVLDVLVLLFDITRSIGEPLGSLSALASLEPTAQVVAPEE